MGSYTYRALIVSGWDRKVMRALRREVVQVLEEEDEQADEAVLGSGDTSGHLAKLASPLTVSYTGGLCSFAVFPCGSKDDWSTDARYVEALRRIEEECLRVAATRFGVEWAFVQYYSERTGQVQLRTRRSRISGVRS
jgi:hypothetical protein